MARVTVIVPMFNSAKTIAATLRSVLDQSYEDWELVVVDDGSADGGDELAQSLSPRVQLVRSPANRGPAAARNLGVERARGELLAFLDADDLWLPEYLDSQVACYDAAMRRYGDVGVVACDAYLEDDAGRRLPHTYRHHMPFPHEVTIEALLEANPIFVSALASAEIVRAVGGFDTRTFGSEDHDLWLKVAEHGARVIDNPVPLAVYRLSGASVSSRRAGMARTNQATYRLALARGQLSPSQQRLARRRLRHYQAVQSVEEYLSGEVSRRSPRALARLLAGLAVFATYAVTHPGRWPAWVAAGVRGRAGWRAALR